VHALDYIFPLTLKSKGRRQMSFNVSTIAIYFDNQTISIDTYFGEFAKQKY